MTELVAEIVPIFSGAATSIASMLTPIMTAGVGVFVGVFAFKIGKKIFKNAVN